MIAPTAPASERFDLRRLSGFAWRLVVYVHLVASAFWWWLMPGGFPVSHPRFWSNLVFPLLALAVCLSNLWCDRKKNATLGIVVASTIPIFWLTASLVSVVLFPISARRFLPAALVVVTGVMSVFAWRFFRESRPHKGALLIAGALAGFVAAGAVCAQRAPSADTAPRNAGLVEFGRDAQEPMPSIDIGPGKLLPYEGSVRFHGARQHMSIDVWPLLSFESRSPDRCWTILSPRRFREGPSRTLTAIRQVESGWEALYRDDGISRLLVVADGADGSIELDASSRLESSVYSHLNTYSQFLVHGHSKLSLTFSPCPEERFEVKAAEYPFGLPIRLAYVDSHDVFHVVQAASGEKGPFQKLAQGMLGRDETLGIIFWDDDTPVCRVLLDDWAAQASRSLSPTAGWGLPQNAIEFRLLDDAPASTGAIWLTLAGTSVGRGWDSVGHTAGTYRNRLRVEPVSP